MYVTISLRYFPLHYNKLKLTLHDCHWHISSCSFTCGTRVILWSEKARMCQCSELPATSSEPMHSMLMLLLIASKTWTESLSSISFPLSFYTAFRKLLLWIILQRLMELLSLFFCHLGNQQRPTHHCGFPIPYLLHHVTKRWEPSAIPRFDSNW